MKVKNGLFLLIPFIFLSCSDTVLPKPKAFLRLEYPEAIYQKVVSDCPYSFQVSQQSVLDFENNCWLKIHYPSMNATLHVTYREVNNDLEDVLREVEKLTFEHTVINVEGNVASNLQFHVTDSVKNVLYGSLYFNVKPNYDSILPSVMHIEKDIKNLMESVEWKN